VKTAIEFLKGNKKLFDLYTTTFSRY